MAVFAALLTAAVRDAPSDWRRSSFAFPVRRQFHILSDQTDVGISGALHPGVGFFGHLKAGSATPPCGWGGHKPRGPEFQRFHVLHSDSLPVNHKPVPKSRHDLTADEKTFWWDEPGKSCEIIKTRCALELRGFRVNRKAQNRAQLTPFRRRG